MRIPAARSLSTIMVAAALTIVPLAGTPASAKQEMLGGASQDPARTAAHCFRHRLRIGMTERQALESDWCYPNDIRQSTNSPGVIEYWFYGHGDKRAGAHTGMILIDDGVVTYFSEDGGN